MTTFTRTDRCGSRPSSWRSTVSHTRWRSCRTSGTTAYSGCWYVLEGHYDDYGAREIRAHWHGAEVDLLWMTDAWEFGRAYRALRQALNLAS